MTPDFINFYRKMNECYGQLLLQARNIIEQLDPTLSLNEQADRVFALREVEKRAKDLQKEISKVFEAQQKLACIVQMTGTQDGADTEYCSGHSNEQAILDVPQKRVYNPEAFDKIMDNLGIPKEVTEAELVRPHWQNLQEHYNRQLAEGRSLPVEMKDTFVYKFTVRKKKNLD